LKRETSPECDYEARFLFDEGLKKAESRKNDKLVASRFAHDEEVRSANRAVMNVHVR
jgi:hypothetical protein